MESVRNSQILQRNAAGWGQVPFAGTLTADLPEGAFVYARATREDDNLPAKFHYAWRTQPPVFVCRDFNDQPLLACYGVELEAAEK